MQGQCRGLLLGCLGAQLRLQNCRKNKPRDCCEGRSLRCSLAPWPLSPSPKGSGLPCFTHASSQVAG